MRFGNRDFEMVGGARGQPVARARESRIAYGLIPEMTAVFPKTPIGVRRVLFEDGLACEAEIVHDFAVNVLVGRAGVKHVETIDVGRAILPGSAAGPVLGVALVLRFPAPDDDANSIGVEPEPAGNAT